MARNPRPRTNNIIFLLSYLKAAGAGGQLKLCCIIIVASFPCLLTKSQNSNSSSFHNLVGSLKSAHEQFDFSSQKWVVKLSRILLYFPTLWGDNEDEVWTTCGLHVDYTELCFKRRALSHSLIVISAWLCGHIVIPCYVLYLTSMLNKNAALAV